MPYNWLESLLEIVKRHPIIVVRISKELLEKVDKVERVAVVQKTEFVKYLAVPAVCLLFSEDRNRKGFYLGYVQSRRSVATIESRINIRSATPVKVVSEMELVDEILALQHQFDAFKIGIFSLTPEHSVSVILSAYAHAENHNSLIAIEKFLADKGYDTSIPAIQLNAIEMALEACISGMSASKAILIETVKDKNTALSTLQAEKRSIYEDNVINHDARVVPGYNMVGSDFTGRAVFESKGQRLEIITANRNSLEHAFGVDLIFFNQTNNNIVMVQYKMLDQIVTKTTKDWIYRPDDQLQKEMGRMKQFVFKDGDDTHEFRLNSDVFYLKFVRRDSSLDDGSVIMPLTHFERYINGPDAVGERGGRRLSSQSLSGRFMKHNTFLHLIQAGYLGTHSGTTEIFETLIQAVLKEGSSVVAAIQSKVR